MAGWDKQKKRWRASVGTGLNRRWFYAEGIPGESGKPGEQGEKNAEKIKAAFINGPEPCRPGSINEFVQLYWWPWCEANHAYETARVYRSIFDRIIAPYMGNDLIATLQFKKVQGLVDSRLGFIQKNGKKLSAKTIRNEFGVLQSIVARYRHLERITNEMNPCDGVEVPKVVKRKFRKGLTIDMGEKMDAAFEGTPYEGFVWASQRLCLRANEALGLRPEDIELLNDDDARVTLRVNRQPNEIKEQLKNQVEGEYRSFIIPRDWAEKILSYHYPGAEFIFCDRLGKPLKPNTVNTMVSRIRLDKKIPVQRKEMRNMGISNLIRAGANILDICDITGHKSTDMTQIYKDIDDAGTKDATSRLKSAYEHKAEKK